MNSLEKDFAAAIKLDRGIDLSLVDATIRRARRVIIPEHIETTVVSRRYALTLFARGFHSEAMEAAQSMFNSAMGLHNAVENSQSLNVARRVIEGGRKGAARVNSERAKNSKRETIVAAIKSYKGAPRSMAGIIAKKFDVSSRYVREIRAELALP